MKAYFALIALGGFVLAVDMPPSNAVRDMGYLWFCKSLPVLKTSSVPSPDYKSCHSIVAACY